MTWTAAFGVGVAGLFIHRQPLPLADPASCGGALELGAAVAARLAPSISLMAMLRVANAIFTVVAVAAVSRLAASAAQSVAIGAAVGLAAAAMAIFAPEMAPSAWAAIGAAAWALATSERAARAPDASGNGRRASRVAAIAALALCAAIAPPLTVPFALIACGLCWPAIATAAPGRRAAWIGGTVVVFALVAMASIYALPPLRAFPRGGGALTRCLLPAPSTMSASSARQTIATVFAGVGPLALSLAALGAFSLRGRARARATWVLAAIAIAPVVIAGVGGTTPARTLAPLTVAFWWLVAAGLGEVASALDATVARRIVAAAIVAAVPVFQLASLRDPAVPRPGPLGHENLSGRRFARLAGALPSDSLLVVEDAVADILERASAQGGSAASKHIGVVSRRFDDLLSAAASHRVFALPMAQLDLQQEGFRLQDPSDVFVRGLSEVLPGGACGAIGATWTDLPGITTSTHLAFVADGADARGPIIIYLGSDVPLEPSPLEWPGLSRRGFFESHYDTGRDADRRQLESDLAIDAGPAPHPAVRAPIVTRLELWRVPGAPLSLVVSLDRAPAAAVARTLRATADSGIRVCPSFEHKVSRLEIPVR